MTWKIEIIDNKINNVMTKTYEYDLYFNNVLNKNSDFSESRKRTYHSVTLHFSKTNRWMQCMASKKLDFIGMKINQWIFWAGYLYWWWGNKNESVNLIIRKWFTYLTLFCHPFLHLPTITLMTSNNLKIDSKISDGMKKAITSTNFILMLGWLKTVI